MPVQHAAKVYKSIWDVFGARVFGEYAFFIAVVVVVVIVDWDAI